LHLHRTAALHVYFDLDGTLTDPFEGISKSILYALERLGAPPASEDVLKGYIGPPLLDTFAELVGDESAPLGLAYYRERFGDIGWRENVPYPGIEDVLASVRDAGATLYVATSKPTVFAEKIVSHFGLAEYFDDVHGSELDGTRVNKTELLAYYLAQNGSDKAVMIGDRKHDVIGGLDNDMVVIGVTYGYGSERELREAGACRIAARPVEIVDYISF
jgi:phosphoglycolate phosphatase